MACHEVLLTTSQSKKANFDASHELEELLLEDNPLKAKARKQNRDINSLSAEMRQMEEQYVANRIFDLRSSCLI
jgi:serine/threonine kinase 32